MVLSITALTIEHAKLRSPAGCDGVNRGLASRENCDSPGSKVNIALPGPVVTGVASPIEIVMAASRFLNA
jgi:hypothetical protein